MENKKFFKPEKSYNLRHAAFEFCIYKAAQLCRVSLFKNKVLAKAKYIGKTAYGDHTFLFDPPVRVEAGSKYYIELLKE